MPKDDAYAGASCFSGPIGLRTAGLAVRRGQAWEGRQTNVKHCSVQPNAVSSLNLANCPARVNAPWACLTDLKPIPGLARVYRMTKTGAAEPNRSAPAVTGRYSLQGVSRALHLLNALAGVGAEGLSLTEAATEIGATKSTTFSLLRTLLDFDYVCTFDRGPRYRLGPAVVHLADGHSESLPWLEHARPVARALTERTGWTSRVASHIGAHPVFEDRVDAPGTIRFFTELGIRELPHVSAAGKAILACLPEAEVRRVVAESGLPRRTRNTITEIDILLRDLQQTASRGYAIDDEEDDEGVFCIAAAFQSRDGEPLGAISITGLKADMPDWRVHQFGLVVRESANQIARAANGPTRITTQLSGEEGDISE